MTILGYIENIGKRYASGIATEHTFRGDLQNLLEAVMPDIRATNEPKRIECGAPDYVLTRKDIPVGYIEAKDVGLDLDSKSLKEQFDRYRKALDNLIVTDYLEFRFRSGCVLKLGSTVTLGGTYAGRYLVSDTGGRIKGKKIDIWMPSCPEARKFGRRNVQVFAD